MKRSHGILFIILLAFSVLMNSCGGTNTDAVVERSCSEAEGLWTITRATCDGVLQEDVAPETFLFDSETSLMTQTVGRVDCATTRTWHVEAASDSALFSLTGQGAESCTESGLETNSCSSDVNTCNSGIDFTGIQSEFPTCVITNDGMSLIRTVSSINNPDGQSFCQFGEQEEVTLIQGDYTPDPELDPDSDLAFLEISGPNPVDFGTHPVGDRIDVTLTVSNAGNGQASSITPSGLDQPFSVTANNCTEPLASGAQCTIELEFFPSVADYFSGTLSVSYNNGSSTVNLSHGVAGTASDTLGQLVLSNGPTLTFAATQVGMTDTQTMTLSNVGGGDALTITDAMTLAAPFQYSGGAFPGTGGTCTAVLSAGSNCTLELEFSPVSDGNFNDAVEINYLDGINNQQVIRNVFGQGTP